MQQYNSHVGRAASPHARKNINHERRMLYFGSTPHMNPIADSVAPKRFCTKKFFSTNASIFGEEGESARLVSLI